MGFNSEGKKFIHQSVLLQQALEALNLKAGDTVADLTFGLGGHSKEILKKIGKKGLLYAFDKDPYLIELGKKNFKDANIVWINDTYANVAGYIEQHSLKGVLADLGVSSYHFDEASRGFSFNKEAFLDMRLNPEKQTVTAADIVNTYSEKQLTDIFITYGEQKNANKIAKKIKQYTKTKKITSTLELARLVSCVAPTQRKLHPATKIFQALRIIVNEELGELARMLESIPGVLAQGAVCAVISFHSLEDRIVKQFFKRESTDCICDTRIPICTCHHKAQFLLVTKKPIIPTEEEINLNRRARSARLRVATKI
jgi:16S rRNA (cytosine1402-N4)-methyltransferase